MTNQQAKELGDDIFKVLLGLILFAVCLGLAWLVIKHALWIIFAFIALCIVSFLWVLGDMVLDALHTF